MKDKDKLERHFDVLDQLHNLLYSYSDTCTGGPLHIVLDDGNMYDDAMKFCRDRITENDHKHHKSTLAVCSAILDILEELSPAQRKLWYNARYEQNFLDVVATLEDKTYITNNHCEVTGYAPWVRP